MLRNEKGFTLLEIIVSMTILAGGVLTLVQMFSGSINQATQADRYLNGVYLAQQRFSQLEIDNFQSDISEGTFEDHKNYRWQLEVLPYESSLNDESARIKIEEVSLRVYWKDNDREKEVQLVSLNVIGEAHSASAEQLDPLSKSAAAKPKKKKAKTSSPSIFNNFKGSKSKTSSGSKSDDFDLGDDDWDDDWDNWDDDWDNWEDAWYDE
jgi:prepilin-type N-terminal cleavage/methylation domain-containing protein